MKTIATIIIALTLSTSALAESGKVIPRAELPEAVKSSSSKGPAKFPGIPACSKGRIETSDRAAEPLATFFAEHQDHKCASAATVYVCVAFGKLSVRCE